MKRIKAITTCSMDVIEDQDGNFNICEFNQGLQSGGDEPTWVRIIRHYQELFPHALIEDSEKAQIAGDLLYEGLLLPMRRHQGDETAASDNADKGLVIFRLFMDAKKEFALHHRYQSYNPIIADPPALHAVYKNKAYAAALDERGIFPKTIILTAEEIRNGALLDHFGDGEKIIIKCPQEEATKDR